MQQSPELFGISIADNIALGVPDAARLVAAAIAVLAGVRTRSGLWAVICGAAALYLTPVLLGVLG